MKDRTSCKGCIYRRVMTVGNAMKICWYALDTGQIRGCPPDQCDKKQIGERERKTNFGKLR